MLQTRAFVQRSKGKNWRYKQNTRMLGLSCRRLALGAARRGARGVVRGGAEWICSASRWSARTRAASRHSSRDDKVPLTEQIEEIATLPFHHVRYLIKACLPQYALNQPLSSSFPAVSSAEWIGPPVSRSGTQASRKSSSETMLCFQNASKI
jgi:hypothetical protein